MILSKTKKNIARIMKIKKTNITVWQVTKRWFNDLNTSK